MTDDLVTWLRQQLDVDAAEIAKHPDGEDEWATDGLYATAEQNYPCAPYLGISKQRALTEVDSKRRILDLYDISTSRELRPDAWELMKHAVRVLALPYADRPGYRDQWRP